MPKFEGVLGVVLFLVFIFLLLNKSDATNQILGTLGTQSGNTLKILQGR